MNTTRTPLTWISPAESLPSLARAKSLALAILATLGLVVLAACDADSTSSVTTGFDQSELRLTPAQLQIDNHSKTTLELRRIFSDGRSVPASGSVTWTSSSPAVATVSSSGEVSARLPGEVTITARTDRGAATARIEILPTNLDLRLVVDDSIQVPAGADEAQVLTARIVDVTGRPVPGLQVDFGVLEGEGAAIYPARAFTDTDGFARATITAGTSVAEVQAEATSPGIVRDGASAAVAGDEVAPFWATLRRFFRIIVNPSFPAEVEVTPGSVSLDTGTSAALSALVRDSYGNTISDATLAWSSSDASGAPVSGSGEVVGMSATSAEITATASDNAGRSASGTAQVEVRAGEQAPPPPSLGGIAVAGGNNQSGTVGQNLASALAVRALDTQGNALSGVPVQWEVTEGSATLGSSQSATASTGLATTTVRLGTQAGQIQVRASAPGVTPATFTLTANPGAPTTVQVSPASATVAAGETLNLEASARDQHGNAISSATFAWSSSDTEVATVNSSGRITARASGSADIRAQAGSATGSAAITVPSSTPSNPTNPTPPSTPSEPGQVSDLQVISATATSVTLRFTEVDDGTGNPALYNIRFRDAASFGNWGTAQAVSMGSCSATMASPLAGEAVGTVRTCTVTGLTAGTDYTFRMVAFRRDGTENVYGALSNIGGGSTVGSGDDSGNGDGDGNGDNGNGDDGSSDNGASATTLSVSAPTTNLTSLGEAVQLQVQALDAGGSPVSTPPVTWTSSNNSVATVNSSGRVIANAIGTAVISVAAACCSADQVTIEVTQQVASIEVTPGSTSLIPGQTQQFAATARDANGNAVPGVSFSWSSTNTSVANVSGSGFTSAVGLGSATIRAQASGITGQGSVAVSGGGGPVAPWYEQHWDYASTAQMLQSVHRVSLHGSPEVSLTLLGNQPGGLTNSGNVLRANYGSSGGERFAGVDLLPPRFNIDRPRELWIDIMMRYDANWSTQTDDKTFFILQDWSASGGPNEVNRWDFRKMRSHRWWMATDGRRNVTEGVNLPNAWNGEWGRLRVHARMATTDTSCDAVTRVWWNDQLVINGTNLCIAGTPPDAFFRNIALGRNADPVGSGVRDWGRVLIYIQDPGW